MTSPPYRCASAIARLLLPLVVVPTITRSGGRVYCIGAEGGT